MLTFSQGPAPPEFNDPEKQEAIEAAAAREGPHVGFMQGRIKFFSMLLRQIKRCGIEIQWGKRVVEYYEKEAEGLGGVKLDDGECMEADIVVAAGESNALFKISPK
jgi:2-polyprenyl-6-methoxyphenol hydroxylase-like FAD-dependent oxidoreductase